jgi:penicillin-binding protein 1A
MKKVFLYSFFVFLIVLLVAYSIFLIRHYYSAKGGEIFLSISEIPPMENKKFVIYDRYGEKFFEKTVYFSEQVGPSEIDDIASIYLKNKCVYKGKLNYFYSTIFGVSQKDLSDHYAGCLEIKTKNKYELYGFYKYLTSVNKKHIAVLIFNKKEINDKIKGLEGLAQYLFGRRYDQLNNNEKMYTFYIFDNPSRLNGRLNGFEHFKRVFFNISSKEKLLFDYGKSGIDLYPLISRVILGELKEAINTQSLDNYYIVNTSFDPVLYKKIMDVVYGYFSRKDPHLQSAGVVIDYDAGKILAMYGAKTEISRINRAVELKRQVGSIFKPIVYLTAFEQGISKDDIIKDEPTTYGKGPHAYSPKNFEDFFMGKTRVENALIYSLNNGTLQVALKAGLDNVANMALKLGMEIKPYLGYCLGAGEFSVMDVANYFSVIANDGVKKRNSFIIDIKVDNHSIDLSDYNKEEVVASPESTKTLKNILAKVVKIGTARGAGLLPGTVGKTGTTNDYRDAWFASIYDRYVIVTWVGRDDYKTMEDNATGGSIAAPLVARIQRLLLSQ